MPGVGATPGEGRSARSVSPGGTCTSPPHSMPSSPVSTASSTMSSVASGAEGDRAQAGADPVGGHRSGDAVEVVGRTWWAERLAGDEALDVVDGEVGEAGDLVAVRPGDVRA